VLSVTPSPIRDDHRLHVLNGTRQIGIVLVIGILGESGYAYERQDRKKEFFHIRFLLVYCY